MLAESALCGASRDQVVRKRAAKDPNWIFTYAIRFRFRDRDGNFNSAFTLRERGLYSPHASTQSRPQLSQLRTLHVREKLNLVQNVRGAMAMQPRRLTERNVVVV